MQKKLFKTKSRLKNDNNLMWNLYPIYITNYPKIINPNSLIQSLTSGLFGGVDLKYINNRQISMDGIAFSVNDENLFKAFLNMHGQNNIFIFRYPGKYKGCESEIERIFYLRFNKSSRLLDLKKFEEEYGNTNKNLPIISMCAQDFLDYLFYRVYTIMNRNKHVINFVDLSSNRIQDISVDRMIPFFPHLKAVNLQENDLQSVPVCRSKPDLTINYTPRQVEPVIPPWAVPSQNFNQMQMMQRAHSLPGDKAGNFMTDYQYGTGQSDFSFNPFTQNSPEFFQKPQPFQVSNFGGGYSPQAEKPFFPTRNESPWSPKPKKSPFFETQSSEEPQFPHFKNSAPNFNGYENQNSFSYQKPNPFFSHHQVPQQFNSNPFVTPEYSDEIYAKPDSPAPRVRRERKVESSWGRQSPRRNTSERGFRTSADPGPQSREGDETFTGGWGL